MLKFVNYDIVFTEVPGEVTLAINIAQCPNHCKGCHTPYLMEDVGNVLDTDALQKLLNQYHHAITCVSFMGGDATPFEVEKLAFWIKKQYNHRIKTAWYSGKNSLPKGILIEAFDFIKLGSYIEELGGLDSETTNQRFYKIENGMMVDFTTLFSKRKKYSDFLINVE